ncbi:MAG: hypothetical protein U0N82_07935 [Oscillospiraceae bacterium]
MYAVFAAGSPGWRFFGISAPIAYVNIGLPILAGVILRRNKWWGSLFGIAMGSLLMYFSMIIQPQMMAGFVVGLILIVYYAVAGILCAASIRKSQFQENLP